MGPDYRYKVLLVNIFANRYYQSINILGSSIKGSTDIIVS